MNENSDNNHVKNLSPRSFKNLLGEGQLRLKGNCHCHSTYSDGKYPPGETVQRYRDAGYDFLYLTEHCDKLTFGKFPDFEKLDSADLRVMPGVEYRNNVKRYGHARQAFLLGLNTLEVSHWRPGLEQQPTIDAINESGGMAVLCCTRWDGRTAQDMLALKGVTGIEVFNATCENNVYKGNAVAHWDELLESGMRLFGLAVDDCHFSPWPDFALAWVVVCAAEKTSKAIQSALRAGSFYSSCGPTIEEWSRNGNTIKFRCSPVKIIVWNSITSYGHVFRDPSGGLISEVTLDLKDDLKERWLPDIPFVRFSCCDADGHWAWTNPHWLGGHGE